MGTTVQLNLELDLEKKLCSIVEDVIGEVLGRSKSWSSTSKDTPERELLREAVRERVRYYRDSGQLAALVNPQVDEAIQKALQELAAEEARKAVLAERRKHKKAAPA